MSKLIIITLVLLLLTGAAQAQHILTWNNSVSNDKFLSPVISEGQSVIFNVDVVDVTMHHWYRDGVDQSHNFDTFTTNWDKWGDAAEITYYGTGAGTPTENLTWAPVILRARATSTAIPVDTTRSDDFINATDDMDFELMLAAQMYMYTDLMGVLFFLFIIGVPMTMTYIRTESLLIPGILGIVSGGFLISFMPTAYQAPAVLLIVISIAGIIMGLFKERTT